MSTRRLFLRGLAAAPLASVPVMAMSHAAAEPDPTFALIEAHRAAWDDFGAVTGEWSGKVGDEPPEFEAQVQAACAAESEAMEELLTPEPTTLAGLRALAEHMAQYDEQMNGECCSDEPERWALITIAEACRNLIPGGVA